MDTTDRTLVQCSGYKQCGKPECEHSEPHFLKSLQFKGTSICLHTSCQGRTVMCEPCATVSWEL